VRSLTLPDRFIEQNKPLIMDGEAGLDAGGIVAAVFAALGKELDAKDLADAEVVRFR
jgi:1-deoxy-D-xylulose-5-phosphate synthase